MGWTKNEECEGKTTVVRLDGECVLGINMNFGNAMFVVPSVGFSPNGTDEAKDGRSLVRPAADLNNSMAGSVGRGWNKGIKRNEKMKG